MTLRLYADGLFLACEGNQFERLFAALWENKELRESQPELFNYMPNDKAYQASYVDASRPLSSSLDSEWIGIATDYSYMAKYENASIKPIISFIRDAFCQLIRSLQSLASGKVKGEIMCFHHEKICTPIGFQKAANQIEKEILVNEASTRCLVDAILILEKVSTKMDGAEILFWHQLYSACSLHGRCILVDCSAFNGKIMSMLYCIFDMLQMKGFMDDADELIMKIKSLEFKNSSIEQFLTFMLETRRLCHGLCVSTIDVELVKKISDSYNNVDSWLVLFEKENSLSVGFQQNFSFLFASSYRNSGDHVSCFRSDITAAEVANVASGLISKGSTFLAGYLYLDLSQRLISNGKLIEALSFAKEAHKLHATLFTGRFKFNELQKKMVVDSHKILPFASLSRGLNDTDLSPWKVMQCNLESYNG